MDFTIISNNDIINKEDTTLSKNATVRKNAAVSKDTNINKDQNVTKHNTCRNCGIIGHLYRECPQPITSYGIICYRINKNNAPEYLMIQRKDSLCFMEFIRGKYDIKNTKYICQLIKDMTTKEKNYLITRNFDDLWNHVWYQTSIQKHTNEFVFSKSKFETLRKGFQLDNKFINLEILVDTTENLHEEPEWGFPKGRRRLREEDINCAIREFTEETGITNDMIVLKPTKTPFAEVFFGTNHVLYRHIYFIAKIETSDLETYTIDVDINNINQIREVQAIQWFSYENTMSHIRDHNLERKKIFREVHNIIKNEK